MMATSLQHPKGSCQVVLARSSFEHEICRESSLLFSLSMFPGDLSCEHCLNVIFTLKRHTLNKLKNSDVKQRCHG